MSRSAAHPRRFTLLDELRGVAIVMMVAYHFLYDLVVFAGVSFPLFSLPAVIWQNSIGMLFITLSGCVCHFSRSNLRRGFKCLAGAWLVFAVTAFTAPAPAWFGVLHLLGCCMLLFPLLRPLLDRIPPVAGLLASLGLFAVLYPVPQGKILFFGLHALPDGLYRSYLTALFGFPPAAFSSSDYYPLLPWLMLFIAGSFWGMILSRREDTSFWQKSRVPALAFLGRHSFLIYLVHQPLLYALTLLLARVIR